MSEKIRKENIKCSKIISNFRNIIQKVIESNKQNENTVKKRIIKFIFILSSFFLLKNRILFISHSFPISTENDCCKSFVNHRWSSRNVHFVISTFNLHTIFPQENVNNFSFLQKYILLEEISNYLCLSQCFLKDLLSFHACTLVWMCQHHMYKMENDKPKHKPNALVHAHMNK